MLYTISYQFAHKIKTLKEHLASISQQTDIKTIYMTSKCQQVVHSYLQQSQVYECGYEKVITAQNISPYLKLTQIVILMNINQTDLKQIQEYNQLFPQMYVLTLTFTNESNYKHLKSSPIRAQVKKIKQIPLNFVAHLDYFYYLKESNITQKTTSFCSYLVSLQKLAQFQLYHPKNCSSDLLKQFESVKQQLNSNIQLMQRHNYKSYDQKSSPRTKVLILDRQTLGDYVSPLLYSYYYGSWMEQIYDTANSSQLFLNLKQFFNPKARILNKIWEMDLKQVTNYILQIVGNKVQIKDPFETNYLYKAKKIMSQTNKPNPFQITAHMEILQQIKQKAYKKQEVAELQQDLANSLNVYQQKLSKGECVSLINKWLLNGKYPTQQQYFKLAMIATCTHNFWFFQASSLRAPLQKDLKQSYEKFQQKFQSKDKNVLTQKPQTEDRFSLFRHQPKIVQVCSNWVQNASKKFQQNNSNFIKTDINSSLKNRQNKFVIYFNGQLGYNQAVLLRRRMKEMTNKQVSIICNKLMSTNAYAHNLCKQQSQNVYKKKKSK